MSSEMSTVPTWATANRWATGRLPLGAKRLPNLQRDLGSGGPQNVDLNPAEAVPAAEQTVDLALAGEWPALDIGCSRPFARFDHLKVVGFHELQSGHVQIPLFM